MRLAVLGFAVLVASCSGNVEVTGIPEDIRLSGCTDLIAGLAPKKDAGAPEPTSEQDASTD